MRENAVEAALVAAAEAEGWISIKLAKTGVRGWTDRLFLRRGIVKPIEIKRPGEKPTRQQMARILELIDAGFDAGWCDNVEDGLAILRR